MATKRTRFDPAAYMMQKLIDELMGGGDDISKQNSLTRYTNTINLHAGGFQSNYDISDLSSRISKIKSFHNGIKKDINYDPIIDEHVNIVIDKINNQLIKTGKFNVEIDNLKNINEQIPDVARRLKDAQDGNKSRGEILSIAEEAKNLVHSRSKASSSLEGLDFTRWSNSPELRFLSNSARVNSSYLVTSMHSDDLFDDREYRTLLQSIESNDPNIALQELKSRRDQAATSDEGLVENIIALGNDVNLQYDAYQTYLGQSNLTEDKNHPTYLTFITAKSEYDAGREKAEKYIGAGVLARIDDAISPSGKPPWATDEPKEPATKEPAVETKTSVIFDPETGEPIKTSEPPQKQKKNKERIELQTKYDISDEIYSQYEEIYNSKSEEYRNKTTFDSYLNINVVPKDEINLNTMVDDYVDKFTNTGFNRTEEGEAFKSDYNLSGWNGNKIMNLMSQIAISKKSPSKSESKMQSIERKMNQIKDLLDKIKQNKRQKKKKGLL